MDPKDFHDLVSVLSVLGVVAVVMGAIYYVQIVLARAGGPIALYAKALGWPSKSNHTCQGAIAGRPAQVTIDGDGAVWLYTAVERPPSLKVHRDGILGALERVAGTAVESGDLAFDGKFVVSAPGDKKRTRAAFDERMRACVKRLFDNLSVTSIDTTWQPTFFAEKRHFEGKSILRARVGTLKPEHAPHVLGVVDELARLMEGVPLHVVRLGGERRAAKSKEGRPRCAWCHESLTGSEPDLVACEKCSTVLHEGCWAEGGKCPTLGCDGSVPERGRVAGS